MAKRVMPDEQRVTPGLNFAVKFIINLTVAEQKQIQEDFKIACANNGIDKAKQLRKFCYELLNVKNDIEFQKSMNIAIRYSKRCIYDKIRKKINSNKEDCFSEAISEKVKEYIKKNKKY